MKKFSLFISIIFALLFFSNCSLIGDFFFPYDYAPIFTLRNNSTDSLVIVVDYNYPDTSMAKSRWHYAWPPQKDTIYFERDNDRETIFKRNSVVQIFAFKFKDWITFYTANDLDVNIVDYHIPYKRYELTREWLEQHDWTVTYP